MVAIQIASALQAAHQAEIVHRDIKPENIILRRDGYVKVLDFGVAKLAQQEVPGAMGREGVTLLVETHVGAILGTVRYMSPGQGRGATAGKSADIWSLGVVLYEMLAGQAPFTGEMAKEVMNAILVKEAPSLGNQIAKVPGELWQMIQRTLRKKSEERYQSARELIEELTAVRRKLEMSAEPARLTTWLRA